LSVPKEITVQQTKLIIRGDVVLGEGRCRLYDIVFIFARVFKSFFLLFLLKKRRLWSYFKHRWSL